MVDACELGGASNVDVGVDESSKEKLHPAIKPCKTSNGSRSEAKNPLVSTLPPFLLQAA
jgi:hypothetical protein